CPAAPRTAYFKLPPPSPEPEATAQPQAARGADTKTPRPAAVQPRAGVAVNASAFDLDGQLLRLAVLERDRLPLARALALGQEVVGVGRLVPGDDEDLDAGGHVLDLEGAEVALVPAVAADVRVGVVEHPRLGAHPLVEVAVERDRQAVGVQL